MKSRKFVTVVGVCLAVAMVTASSALAAPKTVAMVWKVGSAPSPVHTLEEPSSKGISAAKTAFLQTEIGTTPLKIEMGSVECSSCTIFNEEKGAKGKGTLVFKRAKVVAPAACKLWSEEEIITEPMKTDGTYKTSLNVFTQVEPLNAGKPLIEFKLVKGTGSCAIEGTYKVTGSLFFEWANPSGVFATTQTASTSAAINSEAGGSLAVGTKAASLTGTFNFTDGGQFFGVE